MLADDRKVVAMGFECCETRIRQRLMFGKRNAIAREVRRVRDEIATAFVAQTGGATKEASEAEITGVKLQGWRVACLSERE